MTICKQYFIIITFVTSINVLYFKVNAGLLQGRGFSMPENSEAYGKDCAITECTNLRLLDDKNYVSAACQFLVEKTYYRQHVSFCTIQEYETCQDNLKRYLCCNPDFKSKTIMRKGIEPPLRRSLRKLNTDNSAMLNNIMSWAGQPRGRALGRSAEPITDDLAMLNYIKELTESNRDYCTMHKLTDEYCTFLQRVMYGRYLELKREGKGSDAKALFDKCWIDKTPVENTC